MVYRRNQQCKQVWKESGWKEFWSMRETCFFYGGVFFLFEFLGGAYVIAICVKWPVSILYSLYLIHSQGKCLQYVIFVATYHSCILFTFRYQKVKKSWEMCERMS